MEDINRILRQLSTTGAPTWFIVEHQDREPDLVSLYPDEKTVHDSPTGAIVTFDLTRPYQYRSTGEGIYFRVDLLCPKIKGQGTAESGKSLRVDNLVPIWSIHPYGESCGNYSFLIFHPENYDTSEFRDLPKGDPIQIPTRVSYAQWCRRFSTQK